MTLIRYTFDNSAINLLIILTSIFLLLYMHRWHSMAQTSRDQSSWSLKEKSKSNFFLYIIKKIYSWSLEGTLIASSWVKIAKLKGNDCQIISKYPLNMDFWKPSQFFPNYTCTCIFDMWLLRVCCLLVYVLTLSNCHFLCWNVLNKELRT